MASTSQTVLNGPVWLFKVIISLTYSLDLIMVLHFSVTLVALDKVFLKKRSDKLKEWTEDERQVTWTDFAKCTSFPASTQALDPTEGSTVFYSFEFPNQVYGSADVCCTPAPRVRYMHGG